MMPMLKSKNVGYDILDIYISNWVETGYEIFTKS